MLVLEELNLDPQTFVSRCSALFLLVCAYRCTCAVQFSKSVFSDVQHKILIINNTYYCELFRANRPDPTLMHPFCRGLKRHIFAPITRLAWKGERMANTLGSPGCVQRHHEGCGARVIQPDPTRE